MTAQATIEKAEAIAADVGAGSDSDLGRSLAKLRLALLLPGGKNLASKTD